jgi:hypothetical protein
VNVVFRVVSAKGVLGQSSCGFDQSAGAAWFGEGSQTRGWDGTGVSGKGRPVVWVPQDEGVAVPCSHGKAAIMHGEASGVAL